MSHSRFLLSSVVVILALALSACGSADRPGSTATTDSTTATPVTTPTTTAPKLADEHVDLDEFTVSDPLLLDGGSETQFPIGGVRGTATVYLPGKSPVTGDAATLLPSEEIESQAWAGSGSLDEPKLIGAVVVRHPAANLDPEYWEGRLVTVNPLTGSVEKSVTYLKNNAKIDDSQIGIGSGPVVPIVYADTGQPSGNVYYARYFVIGVDTASGRVVWTSDGAGKAATPETIAIERAGSTIAGRDRCARVGVVRVSDGMWLGHMDQPQQGTGCDGQFDYQYGGGAVIGLNRINTYGRADRRIPYTAFDLRTGAKLAVPEAVFTLTDNGWLPKVQYDVAAGIGAYQLTAGDEIVAFDVRNGQTLFSLDQTRAKALNAKLQGIAGRSLIIETTDQQLYVDVDSDQSGTTAPPATAVAHVTGNWTLFTDGTLTNSLVELGMPQ